MNQVSLGIRYDKSAPTRDGVKGQVVPKQACSSSQMKGPVLTTNTAIKVAEFFPWTQSTVKLIPAPPKTKGT
ncbi:hypothetical protein FKM82_023400 [Ascaphus truei]